MQGRLPGWAISSMLMATLASVVPGTTLAQAPNAVVAPVASPVPGTLLIQRDTMIRLMVVNEVTTKTAHAGDRFALRVDEDVVVNGTRVIPVGSVAWGEVTAASKSGAVGKAGHVSARLLYIEMPSGRVAIHGDESNAGPGGAGTTVLAVVGLGVFGLFAQGTNAKLKAGDIFNGYVANDVVYDPKTGAFADAPPASVTPLGVQTSK